MARKDIGPAWNRDSRIAMNDNFSELYDGVDQASQKALDSINAEFDEFKAQNRTHFLDAVATVAERDTMYPTPANGDTVRVTGEASYYRYEDGRGWVKTDQYNPAAIDQVNQQLAEKVSDEELANYKDEVENTRLQKNPQYKYEDVLLAPNKSSRVINPTSDEKYVFDLLFHLETTDNMQGVTFADGYYYVGFDVGGGNGRIRKYTVAGGLEFESTPMAIGHSAELAYRKSNGKIYVANGGGSAPTKVFEIDIEASKIERTIDLSSLGAAGLIGIDNLNDRLIVHTAPDNVQPATFSIVDFDGNVLSQFNIPHQGIPQGLDCYGDQIYFYTNNKITVMNYSGVILETIPVKKSGESQGMTIAGDFSTANITVAYGFPNRLYAMRTVENKVHYNTLQPLVSFNKRSESHVPLVPKFFSFAINTSVTPNAVWNLANWGNGIEYHPIIKSISQTNTEITIELKTGFDAVSYFSANTNDYINQDAFSVAANFNGSVFTVVIRDKSGAIINPANVKRYSSIYILAIGSVSVDK